MTSHQFLAEWSHLFSPYIANHLWQATLFALVVWIAAKSLNRAPARFRYFLWLVALIKFLIPSALLVWLIRRAGVDISLPIETVQAATSTAASGMEIAYTQARTIFQFAQPAPPVAPISTTDAVMGATAANHHPELYCALTIIWLLGASALTARWLIRRWRFAGSLRGDRIITSGREFEALKRAQSRLPVNREIGLIASSQVREPGVWRVRRPVIVFPEGVADRLSAEEIEAVMTHELVHVRRRDNLIGTLQMIVCNLLWFHPLAWLIDRRLLAEREIWCDETVIRLGAEPKLYARSLWKVVQYGLGWPVAGVSHAAGSNLKRRLERMLKSKDRLEMTITRRSAAYASFIALAFLSVAVGLFDNSVFAQRNKIDATDKNELAQGVKGEVVGGAAGAVSGGVIGIAKGNTVVGGGSSDVRSGLGDDFGKGVEAGATGSVVEGEDSAKTVQPAAQDHKGHVESQRQNKWESIKQATEFSVKAENRSDSPILITDARVRVMGWEYNRPLDGARVGGERMSGLWEMMRARRLKSWGPRR